jgi:putative ABC transport system permease protein
MPNVIRRHGAYVAFAMTSLSLAVGATLFVFTVVNALWLRPLPFPNPDRLVMLVGARGGSSESGAFTGLETPGRWPAFEAVAGQVVTSGNQADLRPQVVFGQVGHEVETIGVTSQYFRLLGLAVRGRDFTRDDNRPVAEPVAIISDRLWSQAFGRQSDAIGAVAAATPFPIRIIGVAPPDFEGARRGEHADLWIPSSLVPRVAPAQDVSMFSDDGVPGLVLARLHPGQTPSEAKRRLLQDAISDRDREYKDNHYVVPLTEVFGTSDARTIVIREQRAGIVVAGLAGLVLIAGCATLMALVLVHYERRRRELAIRIALGASRRRLIAELSGELVWLVVGGTAGAVLIAVWSVRALPALSLPGGVDLGRLDLSIDWRVLCAGLSTTVLTLVAAALMPVSRFTRANLAGELIAPGSTTPASSQRLRQALLGLHVAATIVVLVAAGLFVRAVIYGFSAGPGFEIDRTAYLEVRVVPPSVSFRADRDPAAWLAVVAENTRRVQDALRSLPGVEAVAMGYSPIGPDPASYVLAPKTVETSGELRELRVGMLTGSADLLIALGVPTLKGRALTAADVTARPIPAVVTASLARSLWPSDDPLGQVVSFGGRFGRYAVVGIAPDFVYGSLNQAFDGVVVTARGPFGSQAPFVVRGSRPDMLVQPIRKLVKEIVPDAPRVVVSTGREIVARDLGRQRLGAWFFSGFGLIALVLGAGGVFGLVAYLAESRRREFGVRLALGATPGDLVWRGVAAGLAPVSTGASGGLLLSALVARVFVSMLPGLSALDPLTYASVAILMVGCASAAGLAAAWRLRRVAPGDALRAE